MYKIFIFQSEKFIEKNPDFLIFILNSDMDARYMKLVKYQSYISKKATLCGLWLNYRLYLK